MQTKAIIIKKQNTGEYDQWVTCYTEEFGKLKAVAKSILKPSSVQAFHLDIFNLVEFEPVIGRGMPIITGAQVINSFMGVKSSLAKTAVAYFFAEAIDKMIFENDKDDELWSFLLEFFDELENNANPRMIFECHEYKKGNVNPLLLLRRGQARLLDILGYFPETDLCKSCEDKLDENSFGAFNHILGGVVCKKCFLDGHGGILISREDFELLRSDLNNRRDALSVVPQGPVPATQRMAISAAGRSVLDGMFEYISDSKFSSLELMNVVRYK